MCTPNYTNNGNNCVTPASVNNFKSPDVTMQEEMARFRNNQNEAGPTQSQMSISNSPENSSIVQTNCHTNKNQSNQYEVTNHDSSIEVTGVNIPKTT